MQHLVEIKEHAIPNKRVVGCVHDDGKTDYERAFAMNGGQDIFIIAPCKVCFESMYYRMKSAVNGGLHEVEQKHIIYRGFVLMPREGYEFDAEDSDAVKSIFKQIDNYMNNDGKSPMFLKGIYIYKIGVEPSE